MLTSEAAKKAIDNKLANLSLPESWGANATIVSCICCGGPVISIEFTSLDGRKATTKFIHSSMNDGLFHELEDSWNQFVAERLYGIIEQIPHIPAGKSSSMRIGYVGDLGYITGAFETSGVIFIPGLGNVLVVFD